MYVKIDRDSCVTQLPICERCLGRFLLEPLGYERKCFEELVDDGSEVLTIDISGGGVTRHLVIETQEEREMLAREGWATVLGLDIPMYRDDIARNKK